MGLFLLFDLQELDGFVMRRDKAIALSHIYK